uniref:Uncharacterized protein n=1 Tax=Meloidogyne enterolobii TaxID=390850 RepID=A0A6V7V1P9_MELEN|nr:unnamed protein product [Meloidogyne enterolobii]
MSHASQINLKLNSQNINNDTLNNQQKSSLNANKNQENTNRSHELLPNILPRRRLSWAVTEKPIQEEKLERQTNSEDTTNLQERTALNLQCPVNFEELELYFQAI